METLIESNLFTLTRYPFPLPSETSTSDKGANKAIQMPLHTRSWPVLYILSNERANSVYIGETTIIVDVWENTRAVLTKISIRHY